MPPRALSILLLRPLLLSLALAVVAAVACRSAARRPPPAAPAAKVGPFAYVPGEARGDRPP
jgi:hypothetical protein